MTNDIFPKSALLLPITVLWITTASAADWPNWRYDAGRTANSPERLADPLHLAWRRQLPPPEPAFNQVRQHRQQFDAGYEPVVSGNTLLVGSSRNDSLIALNAVTGEERWQFFTDGPVRLAPAIFAGKAYAASDDGHLYCLDLVDGRLLWKLRATPSPRKLLGNSRLISAWPIRGGPVVADGVVYFAAGVWPSEGVFLYAVDAASGKVRWVNDRTGSLYIEHPHGAMAFGGPSPMGYLLVRGDELLVPSGRAFPACFDRSDGRLIEFAFGHGGHGSRPGGWFLASGDDGQLLIDPRINTEIHDAGQQVIGQRDVRPQKDEVLPEQIQIGTKSYRIVDGIRRSITLGGKVYSFDDPPVAVEGEIHTMLAAGGRLFVVTRDGALSCFGPQSVAPRIHEAHAGSLPPLSDDATIEAGSILNYPRRKAGFALVWGLADGRLVEELLRRTDYHVIAVDADGQQVERLRRRLDEAGLYGTRATVHVGDPIGFGFPAYLAELVVSEEPNAWGVSPSEALVQAIVHVLHPFGGIACLKATEAQYQALQTARRDLADAGVELSRDGDRALFSRRGALPGAKDYAGQENFDERIAAPLGLLWFGDTFHHHKLFYKTFQHEAGRGLPQEITVQDGVMRYAITESPYGPNPPGIGYHDYLRQLEREKTYRQSYTDVYTGRLLSPREVAAINFPETPPAGPPQPRPPASPSPRKNPLTGIVEGRTMLKTYGCDRDPVDYGRTITYRSGTAAFYDKRLESGTINIGGVRSGCRNSIVPAGGVLSLPSWTGNCTCNYPLHTSLALVSMPPDVEQWSAWGDVAEESPLLRAGINFGAPGDRVSREGTLWLDWPSVGGPSPSIPVQVEPSDAKPFYRHSLWMEGGEGPPWIAGSGIVGVRTINIEPVVRRSEPPSPAVSIRWHGAVRPAFGETYTFWLQSDCGARLWIGDRLLLDNSKSLRRGETAEISGTVELKQGEPCALVLEHFQTPAGPSPAGLRLSWSSPSLKKAVIPSAAFFTADGAPGGLTGVYYDHPDFSGPAVLRTDATIDFRWDRGRPEALNRPEEIAPPQRPFTVRLYFAEPEDLAPGRRVFSVSLQGKMVLDRLDVAGEAGGPRRCLVRQFENIAIERSLRIEFAAATSQPPLISGIEMIAR
ncbi:MAG: PQQ-binding-like beta-propeller repeat protein [Rhodopirellula sp.]|nr:PQQ-binding-like beta-propeller repeat protein [Rhodopirellula sp.]